MKGEGRRDYLVVTPCRNEEQHLPVMIRCMVSQTIPPRKWIIVDDGSTDRTGEISDEAAARHDFIEVVHREDRGRRRVGPGVIEAFYEGLDRVDLVEYEYLTKLDADIEFGPTYFERLMAIMEAEPRQGNISGKLYLRLDGGRLVEERCGDENAIGPAKFYRTACFREIGGFVHEASWDGIDGHTCRMKGWIAESRDEPEIRIVHRRMMGSSEVGIWTGRKRWGFGKYYMGSSPLYILGVAAYRMIERPFLIGGLGILWGYFGSMLKGRPRFEDPVFRKFLRRYERRALFRGKRRVTREYNEAIRRASAGGRGEAVDESRLRSAKGG